MPTWAVGWSASLGRCWRRLVTGQPGPTGRPGGSRLYRRCRYGRKKTGIRVSLNPPAPTPPGSACAWEKTNRCSLWAADDTNPPSSRRPQVVGQSGRPAVRPCPTGSSAVLWRPTRSAWVQARCGSACGCRPGRSGWPGLYQIGGCWGVGFERGVEGRLGWGGLVC